LHRDNHQCQNPDCKSKTPELQVHHIGYKDRVGKPTG
jgi:5-methylcytosine-specific restriction endonuclease McrA